tara:strand:- start:307 stop:489 length:183 start_codon:yes stop_codon:yes gene_type:complete
METIDITPTWQELLPAMLAVIANPKASHESKEVITEELMQLAKFVDNQNAKAKAKKIRRN